MPLKNTSLQRFAQAIIFSGFFALIGLNAQAADLEIGKLPFEKCVDVLLQNDQAEENQRYWFSRTPPYVGYLKGEKTTAGGDGTCYLGFPSAKKKSAHVLVDGSVIEVFPVASSKKSISIFSSNDHSTIVEVFITGTESTCDAGAETCCGDYTYATITVKKNGTTQSVKAANYTGG